ncbi:Hsp70 family protein [Pseudonocardia endophytica]|uniref:Hsp70 protein n=1 Tax=Pseudonocardia endophytica TaxID=401976 RepID=A0A4R1HYZ6_PSEEN|nr:Hsp70 family protein [Pseudonocardia endophytica]TCK26110.1 Hsp70 protein [Pseudonocardia endophytica]
MGYGLGVDLGTTFTAAAVERDGRVEMATLGDRTAAVPSVVLLRGDGTVLTGDAADRRAASEPDRVAREVKRRLGDPMPVLLGGAPQPVQELMAMQLRDVVRVVSEREGGAPDEVTLTHPANWGPYKKELFGQIPRRAGIDRVRMLTEPEAAAAHYASTERVPEGAVVAVYDLGGGTFDATVLRTSGEGFEILGTPEGIEGLGGIDFDEAVYAHVDRVLDGALSGLDPADIRATAAAIRLRHECVLAKEALSADTEATIPVLLPAVQTEVRLTRGEFETMIQPSVAATVEAMRRALRSAGVTPDELHTVLLVGGSSRIPAVARMVSAELGRPTSVDAHPKHAIALGAAQLSRRTGPEAVDGGPADDTPTPPRGIPVVTPMGAPMLPSQAGPVGPGTPGVPVGPGTPPGGTRQPTGPNGTGSFSPVPLATAPLAGVAAGTASSDGPGTADPTAVMGPDGGPLRAEAGAPPPELRAPAGAARRKRRVGAVVGAGIVVAAAAVGAAVFYGTSAGATATPGPAAATAPVATPAAPTPTEEAAPQSDGGSSGGSAPAPRKTVERQAPVAADPPSHHSSGSGSSSKTWTSSKTSTSKTDTDTDTDTDSGSSGNSGGNNGGNG